MSVSGLVVCRYLLKGTGDYKLEAVWKERCYVLEVLGLRSQ